MLLTRRDIGSVALSAAGLVRGGDVPDLGPVGEPVRIAMLLYLA